MYFITEHAGSQEVTQVSTLRQMTAECHKFYYITDNDAEIIT